MHITKHRFFTRLSAGLIVFSLFFAGCSSDKGSSSTDASIALQEILKKMDQRIYDELLVRIQHRVINRTLWICLPINKTLFIVKRSDAKAGKNNFDYKVTGKYQTGENDLSFGYSLTEGTPYDPQVRYAPTEEEEKIFTFIYRHALTEFVESETGKLEIDFVCIDIIDTVNKVGLSYRFNIDDLKKILFGMVRGVEINIRMGQEFFYVTDEDVKRNKFCERKKELLWGDFIANQVQTRVTYSLRDNDRFLKETSVDVLEDIVTETVYDATKETLENYPFRDVNKLYIKNIALKKEGGSSSKIYYNYELIPSDKPKKYSTSESSPQQPTTAAPQ